MNEARNRNKSECTGCKYESNCFNFLVCRIDYEQFQQELDKYKCVASGKVIIPDNYCGVISIGIEGKKYFSFNDDLPNIILPYQGKQIEIYIKEIGKDK
jgi:hypothetical protein